MRTKEDISHEQNRAKERSTLASNDRESNYAIGVYDALACVLKEIHEIPYV